MLFLGMASPSFSSRLISTQIFSTSIGYFSPRSPPHRLLDLLDSLEEHCPELVCFRRHILDIIHDDALAGGIDEIQDVIHAGDELMDLVTIERGNKGLMEGFEGVVRNLISGMLDVFDSLGILGGGTHGAQHVRQR